MENEKIMYPEKCCNCDKIKENIDINNYVVKYESWEAYNCCCKECARKRALKDGIEEDEIISIE